MNKVMEILRAVAVALGRLVGRVVQTTKWVGGKLVYGTKTLFEWVGDTAAPAVGNAAMDGLKAAPTMALKAAKIGGWAVASPFIVATEIAVGAAKLPLRVLGALGGARQQPQAPQQAAANEAVAQRAAQQQEAERQAVADRQSEARELVQAVRSVAAARARGERLDDVKVARLPEGIRDYLLALDKDECGAVAAASVMGLRGILRGKPPEGVRSPKEIREAAGAEVISEEQVAARRAEVRSAAKAAMRGGRPDPTSDADAILDRYAQG